MALGMALEGPQHLSVLSGKAEGAGGLVVAPDPGVKPLGKLCAQDMGHTREHTETGGPPNPGGSVSSTGGCKGLQRAA